MTKEELAKLGLNDEQITTVLDSIKGYIPKTRFDEVVEERNGLRSQIAERDKQIEELGKSVGDNQALKDQINQLQEANLKATKDYETNLAQVKLDNAVELALTSAKAKNSKAVRALLDLTKSKVGDDGKVDGLDAQIKALQKSDAYLFQAEETPKATTPTLKGLVPIDGQGNPAPKSVKEMSYSEMCEHLANGGSLD